MEYAFAATSVEELCAEIYAARLTAKIHSKINAKMELLRLEIAILQERLNKQAQYRHASMVSQINFQQQMKLQHAISLLALSSQATATTNHLPPAMNPPSQINVDVSSFTTPHPLFNAAAGLAARSTLNQQGRRHLDSVDRQDEKASRDKAKSNATASASRGKSKKPVRQKNVSRVKTATCRPDKICRYEGCPSLKQAQHDGYCIKHCKHFNNAKWAECKKVKMARKKMRKDPGSNQQKKPCSGWA